MKSLSGDLTSFVLDDDACIAVELELASYVAGEPLDSMPDQVFPHLLACPLCLQAALASMAQPRDAEWLTRRLYEERALRGRAVPGWSPAGRIH